MNAQNPYLSESFLARWLLIAVAAGFMLLLVINLLQKWAQKRSMPL